MTRFISHMTQAIPNKTRFCSAKSASHNVILNASSYNAECRKREGYESRLFYAWQETEINGGFSVFLTFTHNDMTLEKNMEKSGYNIACFDNEDFVETVLHGAMYKAIYRRGWNMTYFVGQELGEGKGVRGMNNNPHYHTILFLTPRHFKKKKAGTLTPEDVRRFARKAWQGFDQDIDLDKPFPSACKYIGHGMVSESEEGLEVKDFRACAYCAKYVCKDAGMKQIEKEVSDMMYQELSDTHPEMSFKQLETLFKTNFRKWCNRFGAKVRMSQKLGLTAVYDEETKKPLDLIIGDGVVIDKTIGIDEETKLPYVNIPNSTGVIERRSLPLYFYRKLYYRYEKYDYINSETGELCTNVHYSLNADGIEMKTNALTTKIARKASKAQRYIDVYNQMSEEEKVTVLGHYIYRCTLERGSWCVSQSAREHFKRLPYSSIFAGYHLNAHKDFKPFDFDIDNLADLYAIYDTVYRNRFFVNDDDEYTATFGEYFTTLSPISDYKCFITPCDVRSDNPEETPKETNERIFGNLVSYREHAVFAPFIDAFDYLDMLFDWLDVKTDNKNKADYAHRQEVRKEITKLGYSFKTKSI